DGQRRDPRPIEGIRPRDVGVEVREVVDGVGLGEGVQVGEGGAAGAMLRSSPAAQPSQPRTSPGPPYPPLAALPESVLPRTSSAPAATLMPQPAAIGCEWVRGVQEVVSIVPGPPRGCPGTSDAGHDFPAGRVVHLVLVLPLLMGEEPVHAGA